ncbi:MAG: alkaline phosphatase family protein [Sandaracinaceae bacterium]|nr:alkaline phosphatase family protein [Sandaracinaceae bacterium]
MSDAVERVLVVFVDALGPSQLARFRSQLSFLPYEKSLDGVLGYSSGALATVLTGEMPSVHGRMCLFTAREPDAGSILRPLRWLKLLPSILHERNAFRRVLSRALATAEGLTGYVALHRVPPEAFEWLDMPEREDIFNSTDIGGASTFLSDARNAGLSVYAAPWQLPEDERWLHAHASLERNPVDLAFLYAAALDGALHRTGNTSEETFAVVDRIAKEISRAREAMARGGATVRTIIVGDHGMADVHTTIDPRSTVRELGDIRVFVDSTMLRIWGDDRQVAKARKVIDSAHFPGNFFDAHALRERHAPTEGAPYGDAMFVLDEGVIFAPSYVGGKVAGMHGYDIVSGSAKAAMASDMPIPDDVRSIAGVASIVRSRLGVGA